ncbi:hypothetical protein HCH_00676 [Hahella chejuensis KCTC 2396]|uniref:Uncharacterized protein n=1 Tax=Hahella chejuensis (strain KCTC 2396) TaxID=349521 RepID=Q2SP48_HAHCH|nr:hypothetical protein [Hahella chejuensis]ABC27576.1 hypothetical protein HCH_00676 [Hahella chejuensis KCTC 2396]
MSISAAPHSTQNAVIRHDFAAMPRYLINLSGIVLSVPYPAQARHISLGLCGVYDIYQELSYEVWDLPYIDLLKFVLPYHLSGASKKASPVAELRVFAKLVWAQDSDGLDLRDIEQLAEWLLTSVQKEYRAKDKQIIAERLEELNLGARGSHKSPEKAFGKLVKAVYGRELAGQDIVEDLRLWRRPRRPEELLTCLINGVPWLVYEAYKPHDHGHVVAHAAITPRHVVSLTFYLDDKTLDYFSPNLNFEGIIPRDIRNLMREMRIIYSPYARTDAYIENGREDEVV